MASELAADAAPEASRNRGSWLITAATTVVLIAAISWGRDILAPFLIAAAIVVVTYPVRAAVRRKVRAQWVATVALMASSYSILIVMAVLLFAAASQFAQLVPEFYGALESAATSAADFLRAIGLDRDSAASASDRLQPGAVLAAAEAIVAHLASQVTALSFVVVYIFFLSVDSAHFGLIRAHFAVARKSQLETFAALAASVRRYFAVSATFGAIVAALDVALLLMLQVPGALVWGILAFVTNFIPNIGFVLGLLPAVAFAFLSGGWVTALIVFAGYCVINVVLQTFVQPRFVGEAVHLSQTLAFGR